MGANQFEQVGRGKTAKEAFSAAREQAQWEHGHGGYSGTLAEKDSFGVKLTKPRDLKAPRKDEDPATKALRKEMARAAEQKKSGKARAATANARAPAGAVSDVVRKIADMMRCKGGASMAEMVAATGIEAHPMRAKIKQVRDRLGLRTEAPSKENGFRYFVRDGGGSAPAVAAESPATSG